MGIGTLPALTALVIYAIFPILQNTITGLQGIDQALKKRGTAFGMTKKVGATQKFEIPLAMPVIMSGIRTAAVMIIWDSYPSCCLDWTRGDSVPLSS